VGASLDAAQKATLDAAGVVLAASTAALCASVKGVAPDAETLLLGLSRPCSERRRSLRANLPVGWGSPAFDVLQLEDYDWVTSGNAGGDGAGHRGAARHGSATQIMSSIISPVSC
jgi:hypothetical protein